MLSGSSYSSKLECHRARNHPPSAAKISWCRSTPNGADCSPVPEPGAPVPSRATSSDRLSRGALLCCLLGGRWGGGKVARRGPARRGQVAQDCGKRAGRADSLRAKHRLSKFLLRQGCRAPVGRRAWSHPYCQWLRGLKFAQLADQVVFADYLAEVTAADERVKRHEAT